MATREVIAKSKIYKIKLQAMAEKLETLDDKSSLTKQEDVEYNALKRSYKGTAMAWIKFRKGHNMATEMIEVNW